MPPRTPAPGVSNIQPSFREPSEEYIQRLPKAELHLHLEGSITLPIFQQLSEKYQTDYRTLAPDGLANWLYKYENFYDFLNTYKLICQHLQEPADYLLILEWLREYFVGQNIRYAEVIFTPSISWRFERRGEDVLAALLERGRQIESQSGVQIRWILDCVRSFGKEPAMRTAQLAKEFQSSGVVAIGLGGDEHALPMEEYREVFAWAKAHQLYAHVHAGEIGDPPQVWDALRILGANRIGHGIQAARDPALMDYLREHAIGLDICLTSNHKTRAWTTLSSHPFQLLYKRGVPVTLNTDDPGLFQTSLTQEYAKAARLFGLSRDDLHHIILQSVHCSFLPRDGKMALMQQFQDEIYRLRSELV